MPRTSRERRPRWDQWWIAQSSKLTVWTLNDRFFVCLVYCMLRRVLSEYWRKETEKSKGFLWVVGFDGRCSVHAEQRKKPVAVGPLPGAYLSKETNLVPIRGAPLGLAGVLRTPTMKESQTSSRKNYFLGLRFNMFKPCAYAQFHGLAYPSNSRPCDVVCLH